MIKFKIWNNSFVLYCVNNNPYDTNCHAERHLCNILTDIENCSLTPYIVC